MKKVIAVLALVLSMIMALPQQQVTVQASVESPRFVKLFCKCEQETISVQNNLVILMEVGQQLDFSLSDEPKFDDWYIRSLNIKGLSVEMPEPLNLAALKEGIFTLKVKEKGETKVTVTLKSTENKKTKVINFLILA